MEERTVTALSMCSVQWTMESRSHMAWRNKACWGFGGSFGRDFPIEIWIVRRLPRILKATSANVTPSLMAKTMRCDQVHAGEVRSAVCLSRGGHNLERRGVQVDGC